jgi:hypothetical protein
MRGYLVAVLSCVFFAGCITVSLPPSMTPATTETLPSQTTISKGSIERLEGAIRADDNLLVMCKERIQQGQITTAIGFVRCWWEPGRPVYQQSDLLIMDLVEKRLDVLYRAAVMLDNDQFTAEQFISVHNKLQDWFIEEVRKRVTGNLSASMSGPSPSAGTLYYK